MNGELCGLDFYKSNSQEKFNSGLSILLIILAYINLILGSFVGAIIFGFAEVTKYNSVRFFETFNPIVFFSFLLGGLFSFAILMALSKFVDVANKYLGEK